MKIRATYAAPASFGFRTGEVYELEVTTWGNMIRLRNTEPPHQSHPYRGWEPILEDWIEVTKLLPLQRAETSEAAATPAAAGPARETQESTK